jgi:DNA polymerase V
MLASVAESLSFTPFSAGRWLDEETTPTPLGEGWPLLATPVPAGFPSPADDHVERRLRLDDHLIRQPESTFLMRVQGDELREQGIHSGDLLVVDRAAAPSTGSVVVAVTEGQFCLARVARDAQGQRILHTAGPDGPPLGHGQDVHLWGVVRWSIHRLWPRRGSA